MTFAIRRSALAWGLYIDLLRVFDIMNASEPPFSGDSACGGGTPRKTAVNLSRNQEKMQLDLQPAVQPAPH